MKVNDFDSNDYRYFRLIRNVSWNNDSDTMITYGTLREGSIIKISNEDLKSMLFNSNFVKRIKQHIYPYEIKEYPINEPFDLVKYLKMQEPIVFRYDWTVQFCYDRGDYVYIDDWMAVKMNSDVKSRRSLTEGTIRYENNKVLAGVSSNEILKTNECLESLINSEVANGFISGGQAFHLEREIVLEIPFGKDECWSLMNPSLFFALLNQNFMLLLTNCVEIIGREKDEMFF